VACEAALGQVKELLSELVKMAVAIRIPTPGNTKIKNNVIVLRIMIMMVIYDNHVLIKNNDANDFDDDNI
jgi:hypothetical protein